MPSSSHSTVSARVKSWFFIGPRTSQLIFLSQLMPFWCGDVSANIPAASQLAEHRVVNSAHLPGF